MTGISRAEVGKKNSADVFEYFTQNPFATHHQAAADLGVAICTVSRHYRKFRKAFVAERAARKGAR